MNAKEIAAAMQKGGVGKTTTCSSKAYNILPSTSNTIKMKYAVITHSNPIYICYPYITEDNRLIQI